MLEHDGPHSPENFFFEIILAGNRNLRLISVKLGMFLQLQEVTLQHYREAEGCTQRGSGKQIHPHSVFFSL